MKIKGLFHLHTKYSYDSELEPGRIKEILRERGYNFGVICDHSKDLGEGRYETLARECHNLREKDFVLIPGAEFEFDTVHIAGVGLSKFFRPTSIDDCVRTINELGRIAVWVHPSPRLLKHAGDWASSLNGAEVWSARYGTKYAPSVRLCRTVKKWREEQPRLRAYAGLDAHKEEEIKDLYLEMEVEELSEQWVMKSLAAGEFAMKFGPFCVSSAPDLKLFQKLLFSSLGTGYKYAELLIDRFLRPARLF